MPVGEFRRQRTAGFSMHLERLLGVISCAHAPIGGLSPMRSTVLTAGWMQVGGTLLLGGKGNLRSFQMSLVVAVLVVDLLFVLSFLFPHSDAFPAMESGRERGRERVASDLFWSTQ